MIGANENRFGMNFGMTQTYESVLKLIKVVILILVVLLLGIGMIIFIGALRELEQEELRHHPLDFQDINEVVLEKPIHSVEDGLPYAINRAHEWR